MFLINETLDTNVLVIGGGAAAARAALESSRSGASTLLVTKGTFGSSGTSNYRVAEAAGFSAAGIHDPEDTPEDHYNDILAAGLGPVREELARLVSEEAPKQVPFLEKLGVEYQRYGNGYLATKGCFASKFRSMKIYGHGVAIVSALKNAIMQEPNIQIVEHSMVIDLLVEENECKGAILLCDDGRLIRVNARCTILGAGGAGQLFRDNLNPPDVTGDGYAMAFRAGASIVNMEFMQAGFGIVKPALALFNSWFWLVDPDLKDETGHSFIPDYLPENIVLSECIAKKGTHYPFSSRDCSKYLEISCMKKLNEGGSVFVDLRGTDPSKHKANKNLSQMWELTKRWMKEEKKIDLDNDILQITCVAHAFNGGALINTKTETTVNRLLAVGENAGGAHGADRLGGNMFSSGQVFGEIAGRHAAETAFSSNYKPFSADIQIRNNGTERNQTARELFKSIQDLSMNTLLILRSAEGLQHYLSESERIERDLDKCYCSDCSEYRKRQEAYNILLVGRLVANAALTRTESRGSHYREDYPTLGGAEWRKAICQQLINGDPVLTLSEI